MIRTTSFERDAWSSKLRLDVPVKRMLIPVTSEHVNRAVWGRFRDPVSMAIQAHLCEHACVEVFWNSDCFHPQYADDDARIGLHHEMLRPEIDRLIEERRNYWLPLPRRATAAMWKLRNSTIDEFKEFTMALDLPIYVLRGQDACYRPKD